MGQINITLQQELTKQKEVLNHLSQNSRQEIYQLIHNLTTALELKLNQLDINHSDNSQKNRQELNQNLEHIRNTIEKKLLLIQQDNSEKLEKMRQTVDEKLHQTLEKRLSESFRLVSNQLESVQKGLGEMQNLAVGVGDLKKVLSNVKTKGNLGEYQLSALLEQILAPSQYASNIKTKKGTENRVEFAIKIPQKSQHSDFLWLPIDAKFPTEDYEKLLRAYDILDQLLIEKSKKELEKKIKIFAKDIATKYIDPPNTTDFAILFLPFEGLYAEVLRIESLFESLMREYKIIIVGPTTLAAFLNSLQMGFKTLAIEKRSSEIWQVLATVRKDFQQFVSILDKTKDKLESASKELSQVGSRSRAIENTLQNVELLPEKEA